MRKMIASLKMEDIGAWLMACMVYASFTAAGLTIAMFRQTKRRFSA